jgi:hypothetical protein
VNSAGLRVVARVITVRMPLRIGRALVNRVAYVLPNVFAYQTLLELQP